MPSSLNVNTISSYSPSLPVKIDDAFLHGSPHPSGAIFGDIIASGNYSHAEGLQTTASGGYSHAEGYRTVASGYIAHAEGWLTTALGSYSHAEGFLAKTSVGAYAHAEGRETLASGQASHAEGASSTASGVASHSEGATSIASGNYSHAEGGSTTSQGALSHSEGNETTAIGNYSHTEGRLTTAEGFWSHAEGYGSRTTTSGMYSHAQGLGTIADRQYQVVCGRYNPLTPNFDWEAAFIVGNGTDNLNRSTLFEVKPVDGTVRTFGKTITTDLQITNGATAGYVLTSDASGNGTWQSVGAFSDTFVTGSTLNGTNLEINRNQGEPQIVVDLSSLAGDVFTTGATYDNGTATATFNRNDGNSYTLDLSSIDVNDTFVTGSTLNGTTLEINRNQGEPQITVDLSSLTVDTYVTGLTYNNVNTITLSQNNGESDLSVDISTISGLTATGNINLDGKVVNKVNGSITSGTITPSVGNIGNIRVDGVQAATLADGSEGQLFYITAIQLLSVGNTTVTPTNSNGFTSLVFNSVGDTATLLFNGGNWYLLNSYGVTVNT